MRNLQRRIGSIFRKIAKEVAMGTHQKWIIKAEDIAKSLGPRKLTLEMANRKPEIGVATGPSPGQVMGVKSFSVRPCVCPGKGNIILTGLLGEVMKRIGTHCS